MAIPRRLRFRGVPFVCTFKRHGKHCGRIIYSNDPKLLTWLIGPRVDDPAQLVVRCPQHITERTLRMAGRRRTRRMYRWARLVRENDTPSTLPPGFTIEVDPRIIAVAYSETMKQMKGNRRQSGRTRGMAGPWQQGTKLKGKRKR